MKRTSLILALSLLALGAACSSEAGSDFGPGSHQNAAPPYGASSSTSSSGGSYGGSSSSSSGGLNAGPAYESARSAGQETTPKPAGENDFIVTATERTSTFGVDVDTASYSLMRRDVSAGKLPSSASARPEEYLNYFRYAYPQPTDGHPFSVTLDGAPSRFGDGLHLLRVGLQGKTIPATQRKTMNLTFLVDVSGSMQAANKLPLVKYALQQLVRRLEANDTLAIVTYAGRESVLLQPTAVKDKAKILDALEGLSAGGSTNGEGGIRKAYEIAEKTKAPGTETRVVLCTDGDFNVGLTGDALIGLIESERDKGVTLTTLGFGSGNYNDKTMESLADHGNGNYAYIDNQGEANRVLGEKLVSTLQVIAKDVKIQIELDPKAVTRYRLVGYENRVLANEDFRNDKKDAGEIGAGHSVTALYEVELTPEAKAGTYTGDLAKVRLRYKKPEATALDAATELERPFTSASLAKTFEAAPADLQFITGVAELSEILRHSKHSTGARFDDVATAIQAGAGTDTDRLEALSLAKTAKTLWR